MAIENTGALEGRRLNERLLSMGPESGIVDGECPLISLSYIDKTVCNIHIYVHTRAIIKSPWPPC